jgi:hypothetical protein
MIGTFPDGATDKKAFDFREEVRIGDKYKRAWGWAEYPEQVDPTVVWKYEMYPADEHEATLYDEWVKDHH